MRPAYQFQTVLAAFLVMTGLNILGDIQSAFADFGPKPITRVRIAVQLDGRPLPDDATAALLSPAPQAGDGPSNASKRVPGLVVPWKDDSGQEWNYAGYLWGGKFEDGSVTFHGFMDFKFYETAPQGLPSLVRLAVYDPLTRRLHVTPPARPGQHLALMQARLHSDREGELTSIPIPFWQQLDFWKALLITLIVECVIVVRIVRNSPRPTGNNISERPRRAARLIRVCVLVNLLTLPLVWFFGGEFLYQFGFWLGTLIFLGLELMAFLTEAVFYRGIFSFYRRDSRLPWPVTIRASLFANLTTFLLGFVL